MIPIGNVISKGAGYLFLTYFLLFYILISKNRILIPRETGPIFLWFIFCIISGFFAVKIELVFNKLLTVAQLLVFFFAGYTVIIKGNLKGNTLLYSFLFSMVFVIIYGVETYEPISDFTYKNRIASTAGNPNTLAVFGSFAYIFVLYFISINKKIRYRIFFMLIALILLYGIVNTHSRQGIVLIIASTIIYASLRSHYNYKITENKNKFYRNVFIIVAFTFVMVIIGYNYIINSPYLFRIQTLLKFAQIGASNTNLAKVIDYSAYERSQFIIYGIKIWTDNIFFGIGLDNFRIVIQHYWPISDPQYSHNNYIELLSTIGIFGTIAYYSIYFSAIQKLVSALKNKAISSNTVYLVHIFLTAIISLMLVEFVTVSYYRKYTWLLLVIIIGLSDKYFKKPYNQQYSS